MKEFEHDCCKAERKTASDFLMRPMFRTKEVEGYKMRTLITPKGVIQILWRRKGEEIDVRYAGNPCLTSKITLEALCEWISNKEVRNVREALKKLSSIKGFSVTKEVEDLTREVISTVNE
jgi:hypothetical protein